RRFRHADDGSRPEDVTVNQLAQEFELHRRHLGAVAYRMLGSSSEAEDAVQESWLRLSRADPDGVENMRAWLTTVVSRVCLDMLRTHGAPRGARGLVASRAGGRARRARRSRARGGP